MGELGVIERVCVNGNFYVSGEGYIKPPILPIIIHMESLLFNDINMAPPLKFIIKSIFLLISVNE